ncbi:MAG: hypothetical protein COB93_08680 [Sneathiella sp.]|nr:MAG: hypothetical protein COB93_08680 [Sneathiella sp.]
MFMPARLVENFEPFELVFCFLMTFVANPTLDMSNGPKGGWRNITAYQAVARGWMLQTVRDIA